MMSNETIVLKKGDRRTSNGITIGFDASQPADVNISVDSGAFL